MYPSTPVQALISEAGLVPAQILLDHRQRIYIYRLLTLPDDHIAKNILPISFRKGDADTISADEQPEDTLIWAGNERLISLSQWLVRQVATTQAIDSAFGVEPIKKRWRWSTEVPLQVVVQLRKEALQDAKKEREVMVLWTDGSRSDTGKAGSAVVWLDKMSDKWQEKRRYSGENKDSFDAELWAISDALEISIKKTRNANPTTVTVFTGSHAAIGKTVNPKVRPGGGAVRDLIYQNALDIRKNGHLLVIQWVPSHLKVPGNEKADAVAKDVARKGGRNTDHWSSLTHIKVEIQKTKVAELVQWHQTKSQEREATLRRFYIPKVKGGMSPAFSNTSKKFATRYFQLKVGHGAIGTFLARR